MQLKTTIPSERTTLNIKHSNKIITMGSCFAENIAEKFKYFRFSILDNPFGVLYNPVSIYNSLKAVADEKVFTKEDLIFDQSEWHSFYHHSDFSSHKKDKVLQRVNDSIKQTKDTLSKADLLILTYGTAYVFKHKETGVVVSNCHKLPQKLFDHYRIGMYEAREFIQATIELIKDINPKIDVILTLSPVRHLKNSATGNQLSKAILLLAIHEIINENDSIYYYPSYELMIDDLRDYRYYARDLVHPNDIAVDYIWTHFAETYFTDECRDAMKKVNKISLARSHNPRNLGSKKHQEFLKDQIEYIEKLSTDYPYINLEEDKKYFQTQLDLSE